MADYFRKYKSLHSTTLSSSISTGTGETITFASVTNVPTDTEITVTISRVDSSGTATPTLMERITGTLSGSNLVSYTRGVDNSTEQAHAAGSVVEMVWNAADWNQAVTGLLLTHTQTGRLKNETWYAADSVGTDAYAVTLSPALAALTTGFMLNFKAGTANTGAATLAVNGLTAKAIKKLNDQDLATGDIESGQIVTVVYDGTYWQMQSQPAQLIANSLKSATTVVDVSAATAPSSGQVLTATASTTATWQTPSSSGNSDLYAQALINGGMDVWQRATTFTTPNDDTYGPDRWNFLVDGNGAWTFARDTDVPTGNFKYSLKATNVTLNKQCGIVQILENIDSVKFQDKTASLSFYAKTSGTEIANLRATVLSWTSTADSVTSDVVGTWAGNGTDPTWATNYTAEVAGSNKALTASWQQFTIDGIAVNTSSITNLAVVVWVDDTTIAANDDFWITGIKLEVGSTATAYQARHYQQELALCQRYCYAITTAANGRVSVGSAASTTVHYSMLHLPVLMRSSTMTLTATAGDWVLDDGANAATDVTSLALVGDTYNTAQAVFLNASVASGLTQYRVYHLEADGSARTLILSAEL